MEFGKVRGLICFVKKSNKIATVHMGHKF